MAEKSEEPSAVAQAAGTVVPSTPQSVRGVKVETKRPREGGRKRGILSSKKGHKCSTYGCNRTFLNMQDLIHHVSIHYKPTQSMQDKKFFCSISGCGEILNSMQELMSHLKVHYKPNRYFKCENCMQHFRTHRSLFKHLHVCSDNAARSVSQSTTSFPASSDSDSATPAGPVSRQTSVIQCIKKDTPLPMADDIPTTSMAAVASTSTLPGGHLASMSKLASKASNSFSTFDPNLFGGRVSGTSQTSAASSYLPYMNPSSYNSPQSSMSQKLKPFLGNQSLPASNAMWKKNQAIVMSQRVTREQRIEIVLMSGERSTRVIAADFNARHPTRPPISHATVSKLLAKFRETGSVLDLPKCGRKKTVTNEETSVAVLASFNKSPQRSTRRMSLESGISRTSFRRILAIHKWHPYKIQLLQHLNEHDPDRSAEFSEWTKQKLEQDPQFT